MLVGLYARAGGVPVGTLYCGDVGRALDGVDDLPLQRRLDDRRRHAGLRLHARVRRVHRQVEELVAALFPDPHAVGHAAELLAPRPHELSVAIEHDDRVARFAGRVHGVVNVNVPLGVLHDVVGVSPLDAGRQLTPVVERLVLELTLAQHRRLRPRLVLGFENQRGREARPMNARRSLSSRHPRTRNPT